VRGKRAGCCAALTAHAGGVALLLYIWRCDLLLLLLLFSQEQAAWSGEGCVDGAGRASDQCRMPPVVFSCCTLPLFLLLVCRNKLRGLEKAVLMEQAELVIKASLTSQTVLRCT
jgi:hypothetical protein